MREGRLFQSAAVTSKRGCSGLASSAEGRISQATVKMIR